MTLLQLDQLLPGVDKQTMSPLTMDIVEQLQWGRQADMDQAWTKLAAAWTKEHDTSEEASIPDEDLMVT